jgi:sidestep protein, putative (fragment)
LIALINWSLLVLLLHFLELFTTQTFDYDSINEGKTNSSTEMNQELNYTVINIVTGEEGKAELPCLIEKPNNDTIDLILWFRGNSETALYSLDARRTMFQMAKHFPHADLSSRAYIETNGQ